MPNTRTGQYTNCPYCGTEYYRSLCDIETYNRKLTCGAEKCKRLDRSGKRNPFYGRKHTEETRKKLKAARARNPSKGTGPKKGIFKHTEEAKKRISAASKRTWKNHREKMIKALPRGESHHFHKPPEERRHRKVWTPTQRKSLLGDKCRYCEATDHLELDHIIPIFDGGTNADENAQTLCRGCNLWKTYHVDLPRYQAARGLEINPV